MRSLTTELKTVYRPSRLVDRASGLATPSFTELGPTLTPAYAAIPVFNATVVFATLILFDEYDPIAAPKLGSLNELKA